MRRVDPAYEGKRGTPPVGRRVSSLAGRQGGAISRAQLRGLGVSDKTIDRLLAAGWLAIVHRGVFRLGRLTQTGVLHAAVLALGERALVSHRSAAHEHGLLRTRPPATVDVTVPTTRRRSRAGRHHGIGALRRAPARHDPGRGQPIGDLERRASAFLRDHDFPPYVRNFTVVVEGEPFSLDVVWLERRVALELDSRTFHDNDPSFASDRRRSRRLAAAGRQVVRGTWEDLDERPAELAADVRALLRAAKVA